MVFTPDSTGTSKRLHDPILTSRAFALLFIVAILIAITLLLAPKAGATNVYWDTNSNTTGSSGVDGTWDSTTSLLWTTDSAGTSATTTYNTADGGSPTTADTFFSAGTNATGSYTVTIATTTISAHSITVEEGSPTFTQTSGSSANLSIGAGGITINSGGGTVTFSLLNKLAITLAAAQTWTNNSSNLFSVTASNVSSNQGTVVNGGNLLTISGTGNTTISARISGTGGLTKSGTGILTLANDGAGNASTYTGATTISAGTIRVGANAPSGSSGAFGNATSAVVLGDAATTTNNSNVSLLTNGAFTIGRAITVANQATTGTYTIGGNTDNNSTFSGLVTINQNLTVSQVANAGANALSITGGITSGNAGTKTVTFAGPGNINVGTTAISDGSGTVAVNVTGGKTTFNIANTYTGLTNITGGTLVEGVSNAINTGALTVNGATAVFDLGASHTDTVGTVTLDGGGAINGTGTSALTSTGTFEMKSGTVGAILAGSGIALNKTTAGTVTLNGVNTYTGLTNITAGTLAEGVSNAIATGGVTVNGATAVFDLGASHTDTVGTVTLDGGGAINGTGTSALTSTGTFEMQSGTVGAILAGSSIALNKTTAGTVTLNGVNTYTGLTNITAGTLVEGVSNAISTGAVTVNGATAVFDLGASHTDSVGTVTLDGGGSITGTGTSALTSTGTFEMKSGSVSAILAGSGIALNKTTAGTVTLTGANTYSGATTISASGGTLTIDNNNTTTARLANTSGITVNSGGTLLLAQSGGTASTDRINNSATMTLNGGTFNTGGLSEHGASNNTAGIGALTLQSSSIIDMGSGASIVAFADSSGASWSGTLSIYNWSGDKEAGGGIDQLYFGTNTSGLTPTQLSQFQFYSDAGTTPITVGALILSNGEVVPVPEPATWFGGLLTIGVVACTQRRRFARLLKRAA